MGLQRDGGAQLGTPGFCETGCPQPSCLSSACWQIMTQLRSPHQPPGRPCFSTRLSPFPSFHGQMCAGSSHSPAGVQPLARPLGFSARQAPYPESSSPVGLAQSLMAPVNALCSCHEPQHTEPGESAVPHALMALLSQVHGAGGWQREDQCQVWHRAGKTHHSEDT